MSAVTARLAASAWFSALPRQTRDQVACRGIVRAVDPGAAVFFAGDAPTGLHAVLSGEAKIRAIARNGVEMLIAMLRPVEWTGYLACLDGGPYVYTVTASQDCEVFTLPIAAVRAIFFDDAALLRHLIAPQLAADRKVFDHIVNIVSETPLQRLARCLVDFGRQPYDADGAPNRMLHVSQTEAATSAMMSRQSANVHLRELATLGVIEIGYASITILDPARLERIAEGE